MLNVCRREYKGWKPKRRLLLMQQLDVVGSVEYLTNINSKVSLKFLSWVLRCLLRVLQRFTLRASPQKKKKNIKTNWRQYKVCRIKYEQSLLELYSRIDRQLSLDHLDAEENLKTRWVSGKFCSWGAIFFSVTPQWIYGCLLVMDVGIPIKCASHRIYKCMYHVCVLKI